ncbi:MAG: alpha/beta hydrolase, partial [Erysipelotrichaceae bacterium]|nr:alpha/beta hydrolase [Erysipelotrichaceae bacterium]
SWVGKINELYDDPKIYLHGVSMGGASVIHCADMKLKNVCGIIDDCGYDSITNILDHVWKVSFGIPFMPFGYFTAIWAKLIAHLDMFASDGTKCVSNTGIPVLFIHGSDDHFVPCSMSLRMYEACKSRQKELLMIEGCGHSAAYMCAEKEYAAAVNRLMDKDLNENDSHASA